MGINKEIEVLKKSQTEIKLEIKIKQIKANSQMKASSKPESYTRQIVGQSKKLIKGR